MNELKILPWKPSDKEACLSAFESNMPRYFDPSEHELFTSFLDKLSQDMPRKPEYYSLFLDDELIGCGGICLTNDLTKCCLAWGMVHGDFHKQGFGKALLEFRIQKWREHFGEYPFVLDTTQYSAPFFEKYGFRITAIQPDFYAPGMDRYDMIYTENQESGKNLTNNVLC